MVCVRNHAQVADCEKVVRTRSTVDRLSTAEQIDWWSACHEPVILTGIAALGQQIGDFLRKLEKSNFILVILALVSD